MENAEEIGIMNYSKLVITVYPNAFCMQVGRQNYWIVKWKGSPEFSPDNYPIHWESIGNVENSIENAWKSAHNRLAIEMLRKLEQ